MCVCARTCIFISSKLLYSPPPYSASSELALLHHCLLMQSPTQTPLVRARAQTENEQKMLPPPTHTVPKRDTLMHHDHYNGCVSSLPQASVRDLYRVPQFSGSLGAGAPDVTLTELCAWLYYRRRG